MPEADDNMQQPEETLSAEPLTAEALAEAPAEDALAAEAPSEDAPVAAAPPEPAPAASAPAATATEKPVASAPDAALVEGVAGGLTWIPFAVYMGLWVLLAGSSAYFLHSASPELPARWMPEYVPLLWSGVALALLGPVLSVAVWLFARSARPASARRGLFASAMTRGALVAFFGVALWVGTLFVLDFLASGRAL